MSEFQAKVGDTAPIHEDDHSLVELLNSLVGLLEIEAKDEVILAVIVECIRTIGQQGGEHLTTEENHPLCIAVEGLLCQGRSVSIRSNMYTSRRLFCKVLDKEGVLTKVVWGLPGNNQGELTLVLECEAIGPLDDEGGGKKLLYVPMSEIISIAFTTSK